MENVYLRLIFKLEKNKNGWNVVDKSSKITQFEKSPESDNFGKMISGIYSLDNSIEEVNLAKITGFKWDKAYVFEPYTDREVIYKAVGYKWRGVTETESEDMMQIVFMEGKKPVCYFYGSTEQMKIDINFDKTKYKDNIITIYPNDNDKFKVEKDEESFNTYLEYIIK